MIETSSFKRNCSQVKTGFCRYARQVRKRQRQNCLNFVSALAKVLFSNYEEYLHQSPVRRESDKFCETSSEKFLAQAAEPAEENHHA